MPKPVYQIAAVAENLAIGLDRKLPWSIPEEWNYFINTTEGGIMIMGRICAEEFGECLPNRDMVAVTSQRDFQLPGFKVAHTIEGALAQAEASVYSGPIWICGGTQIYKDTLDVTHKLYISFIHKAFEGDTHYPKECLEAFPKVEWKREHLDETVPFTCSILTK